MEVKDQLYNRMQPLNPGVFGSMQVIQAKHKECPAMVKWGSLYWVSKSFI